jgi:hypothetical protein
MFIFFATLPVHAMFLRSLHSITEGLVLRDISRRGKAAVLRDIMNARDSHYVDHERCMYEEVPVVLHIGTMFHKKDRAEDLLTKNIFESIEQVEAKNGYIPDHTEVGRGSAVMPTNFLGGEIRYYWLEKNGKRLPAVRIDAQLTDKIALQKIVDAHKEEL